MKFYRIISYERDQENIYAEPDFSKLRVLGKSIVFPDIIARVEYISSMLDPVINKICHIKLIEVPESEYSSKAFLAYLVFRNKQLSGEEITEEDERKYLEAAEGK